MPARDPRAMVESNRADEALVDCTRAGDDEAFEQLMRRHSDAIRRLIARYFPNRAMVDDLAQETFVKAYFALSSFRNESPFVYWLKRIAVRLCLDEMRNRKTQEVNRTDDIGLIPDDSVLADSGNRLEAQLMLDKMLERLAPLDRMIIILLYGEGCNTKEVAGLTGLSRANVKVRAFRSRRLMKFLYAGDPK
jgi:RNA polymerase sigma-70 factor, ECF subfamily